MLNTSTNKTSKPDGK